MEKKIEKEFCLTDNSVNCYGYRLLTEGLELERFNPAIGFLNHDRDEGVAVRWEDFRYEGDKLYAKPVINETAFPDLAEQIENGFYRAASMGHIVALEIDERDESKLPGQKGPTIRRWFPRECSIVDIPGNYNALAKLYDESDHELHDLSDNKNNNMNEVMIPVSELQLPNLKADATAEEVRATIADLVARAERVESIEKEMATLRAEIEKEKVEQLIEGGLTAKKLTVQIAERLRADYAGKVEELRALIDAMPAQVSVANQSREMPEKYAGKSWKELWESGLTEELKRDYPDLYEKMLNENKKQ